MLNQCGIQNGVSTFMDIPAIELKNVRVTYQGQNALENISFSLQTGEHCLLLGPNGCGKSTLLKVIRGDLFPSNSTAIRLWSNSTLTHDHASNASLDKAIDTQNIYQEDSPLIARSFIRIVSYDLLEKYKKQQWHISVKELIITGLYDSMLLYTNITNEEEQKAFVLAEELGIADIFETLVPNISSAQLIVGLFARACISSPSILLLDEFTDNLNDVYKNAIFKKLEQIQSRTTIIAASHRTDSIPTYIKRVLRMEKGSIISEEQNIQNLEQKPSSSVASISNRKPSPAQAPVSERAVSEKSTPSSILIKPIHEKPRLENPILIDVKNATVYFAQAPKVEVATHVVDQRHVDQYLQGCAVLPNKQKDLNEIPVLQEINWTLRLGESWGIFGKQGAGKSTFLRFLAGQIPVALGGSIDYYSLPDTDNQQYKITTRDERNALIHLISNDLQAEYSYDLEGQDIVASGFDNSIGLYRKISNMEYEKVEHYMQMFQVSHLKDRHMSTMSTGQKKRVLLARSMVNEPKILLCDDPFIGLDVVARQNLIEIFQALQKQSVQIVLVSQHPDDIAQLTTHNLFL